METVDFLLSMFVVDWVEVLDCWNLASVAFNNEFEPYAHHAVPAEMLSVGSASRPGVENVIGNHDDEGEDAGASLEDHSADNVDPTAPFLDEDAGVSLEDHSADNVDPTASFHDEGLHECHGDTEDVKYGPTRLLGLRSKTFTARSFSKIVFLAIICLIAGANGAFVEFPVNTFVLQQEIHKAVEMTCKSDCHCDLRWFVNKQDSIKETLYDGYILRSRAKSYCTVKKDKPGMCQLNLTNTADAAQTYTCLEPGTLNETSADLIWVEVPICNASSTENLVNLTCTVEFRGNWAPTMEWKEHSSHGEKILSMGVNTTTVRNQRVTSTLVMEVQTDSRNYTCTTKFDISGKPLRTTATNVPHYNREWTASALPKAQDKITTDSAVEVTIIIAAVTVVGMLSIAMVSSLAIYLKMKSSKRIKASGSDNGKQETLLKVNGEDGTGAAVTPPQLPLSQSQA